MVKPPENLYAFESLLEIVKALRGPDGCPWDKEQTHRSLAPYAVEESFELAEAIEAGDEKELVGELGDVLLQVVLHAEIGRQEGRFDIWNVVHAISEKMVRRHPHVFAEGTASNAEEVLSEWSKIKAKEKAGKPQKPLTRFDVPLALPALARSQKIGEKTKRERFDWTQASEVLLKVDEEVEELKAEIKAGSDRSKLEHEIGDVLFSVAQLARHLGLEAEQALRTANSRFESRFFKMKEQIQMSGRNYDDLSPAELEEAWQNVKRLMNQSHSS